MPRKYKKSSTYKLKRKYGRKASKAASTIQSAIRRAINANNNRMLETTSTGSYIDVVDIIKSGHTKHISSMIENMPMKNENIH